MGWRQVGWQLGVQEEHDLGYVQLNEYVQATVRMFVTPLHCPEVKISWAGRRG